MHPYITVIEINKYRHAINQIAVAMWLTYLILPGMRAPMNSCNGPFGFLSQDAILTNTLSFILTSYQHKMTWLNGMAREFCYRKLYQNLEIKKLDIYDAWLMVQKGSDDNKFKAIQYYYF